MSKHKKHLKKKGKGAGVKKGFDLIIKQLAIIVAGVAVLLYANTLNHGYTLDDYSVIKENNVVTQGLDGIGTALTTSYRYGYLSVDDGLYRPLSLVMFAVEWHFFPDDPSVSHWINVLFYALTGVLLLLLLDKLLGRKRLFVSLAATALFIAHPIHTEIVASIKSRDEVMCFMFMILSFYLFIVSTERKSLLIKALSFFSFFLALLSKETGATMLFVFPLMMFYFLSMKPSLILRAMIPFIGVTALYIFIRSNVLDGALTLDSVSYIDNSLVAAPNIMSKWPTAIKVLGMYLGLLIFPHPLVCDRSFNQIPNTDFGDVFSLLSLAVYAAMFGYAIYKFKKGGILVFSIWFFLITIALFSNIFITIGSVMAERFIYFASFGFCLALAFLLDKFLVKKEGPSRNISEFIKARSVPVLVLLIVVVLYGFKTIDRNKAWKDNYTLYGTDVDISKNSTRMHYYLGREIIKEIAPNEEDPEKQKALFEQGIAELQKSIEITPKYAEAYSQMGLGYARMGNKEKTIECYENALKYKPNDPVTMNNLGAQLFEEGRYKECIDIYNKVLKIDPRYVDAMMNLGACYGTVQDYENAIYWFNKSLEYRPNNAQVYTFLGTTYKLMGNAQKSQECMLKAQQLQGQ